MPEKTIEIRDAEALAEALTALAEQQGSQAKAAKKLGISPSDYSRLVRKKRGRIEIRTFERIIVALGGPALVFRRSPDEAPQGPTPFVPTPRDQDVEGARRAGKVNGDLDFESAREAMRKRRAETAESAYLIYSGFRRAFISEELELVWATWVRWMEGEISRLRPLAGWVVAQLWNDETTRAGLQSFLEATGRSPEVLPPHEDLRCWLALLRVAEPLASTDATWGVEPGLPDLKSNHSLASFLKHSLAAQEVLLTPPSDYERVSQGSAPTSYEDWLGAAEEGSTEGESDV